MKGLKFYHVCKLMSPSARVAWAPKGDIRLLSQRCRILLFMHSWQNKHLVCIGSTYLWSPIGTMWSGSSGYISPVGCHCSGTLSLENSNLLKSCWQTCSIFASEGDITFVILNSKHLPSALVGDTLSISHSLMLQKSFLKHYHSVTQGKLRKWRETPMENYLPRVVSFFKYIY